MNPGSNPRASQAAYDSFSPADQAVIRRYLRFIGSRGGKAGNRLAKAIQARNQSKNTWRLRRFRHGESGRRLVDRRLASRLEGGPVGGWKKKAGQ